LLFQPVKYEGNRYMEKPVSYITVYRLLRGIGCREDLYTLKKLYDVHTLPHSIRSISDLLDEVNLDSKVVRLSINQLNALKKPVIVMLNGVSESFYVLYPKDVGQPHMCLAGSKHKLLLLTNEQFIKCWNGITLIAKVPEDRKNEPLLEFIIKQLIWFFEQHLFFVIAFLVLCLSFCLNSVFVSKDMRILSSMIIKGIGIMLSINAVSPVMKRQKSYGNICMGPCHLREEVLVFNWVSLSEISLSYFVSTFIIGLIFEHNVSFLFLLLSCICLGFLIYSLAYQAINARWCLNCILIDCIIIADFIANIYNCKIDATGFWLIFAAFCLIYLIILLSTHNFVEFLGLNKQLNEAKYRKERLLENEQLVMYSLKNGLSFPEYDSKLAISNGIDSEHKVTLIMGLGCPYCRELF
jgi:hypothetical protein